jgi:hypothetical protein
MNKDDSVKIIQFWVEPYTHYESNGSMYKTKRESSIVYGLGDDGKVYKWGHHTYYEDKQYKKYEGWRLYIPEL